MNRRQGLDLTREDVANLVGCAPVTVAKIERDERRPSRQMAERLAEVLRVPPEGRADFLRQARGSNADPDAAPDNSDRTATAASTVVIPEHRGDLPVSPTSFVGREDEVAKVRSLLWRTDMRLLTLTGAPGIGKTRLALQVVASMVDDFADGAQWVALAPVLDSGLVASTIAHAFNLREAVGQTVEQTLHGYLRDKQILLLVDNFEHLVS
ncbi:MAG: helix-turn-helix domain-containing protein, partial [Chloroflexia bacterium]